MMESIDDDYLRYVLHVQVIEEPAAVHDLARASYQAADDPVMGSSAFNGIQVADDLDGPVPATNGAPAQATMVQTNANRVAADASGDVVNTPVMKSPTEKMGRNEPCWCGSGKKFKLCHGRV
jgi:preprotein translocase subunit SecA